MTHQIALTDEEYAALAADAGRRGQSVEDALHAVLAERYPALTDQRSHAMRADEQARALGLDPAALSPLGRDLLAIRAQGIAAGEPLISSWEELDAEIADRRGARYADEDE